MAWHRHILSLGLSALVLLLAAGPSISAHHCLMSGSVDLHLSAGADDCVEDDDTCTARGCCSVPTREGISKTPCCVHQSARIHIDLLRDGAPDRIDVPTLAIAVVATTPPCIAVTDRMVTGRIDVRGPPAPHTTQARLQVFRC